MGTTLVVNPGSSSRKYALYNGSQSVLEVCFEKTEIGFEMCARYANAKQMCEARSEKDFAHSFTEMAGLVNEYLNREQVGKQLDAIVVRIVAPGTYFQTHREIDAAYIKKLIERESAAPLHIPVLLREIAAVKEQYPAVLLVAASDSAFHATLPKRARTYSIPESDAELFDVYRFGYHGLSVASIVRRIHSLIGVDPEKLIVCHVGSGTSVTAVKQGESVETTMGFAPATGLPMGSRSGDIDNAALLQLMREKNLRPREAEMYVNNRGGLIGMAGEGDIRQLLDRRAQHDDVATTALETFAYHIQKAVAAQTVALGGLDVLVLTATASVRSSTLRTLILSGLRHLGVLISDDRNDLLVGKDGVISARNSPVKVVVMRTDEMGEMALIPNQVAIMNRHS